MGRHSDKERTSSKPGEYFLDQLRSDAYELNLYGLRTPGDVAGVLRRVIEDIGRLLPSLGVDNLEQSQWMRVALLLKPVAQATRIAQSMAEREAARLLSLPKTQRSHLMKLTRRKSREQA